MSEQETVADHCWATGDMPVRNVPRLAFLVDGKHKCAGSPDSPQQEALLRWLRAKGLSERSFSSGNSAMN